MYPEYSPFVLQPASDDISGVQRLYGPGGGRVTNPTPIPNLPTLSPTQSGQNVVSGQLSDNQYAHFWDFDVEAGATATISMKKTSGNLDAFLILVDSQNHVIAYDDDSGGGTDAELRNVHFPVAGTYSVIATRFEQAQGFTIGSYALSIQYGEVATVTPKAASANPTAGVSIPTIAAAPTNNSASANIGSVTVNAGSSTQFGQLPTVDSVLSSPFATSATPGQQTRSGAASRSQSYTWDLEWCATTAQTLTTDQASLKPKFTINNQPISTNLIATANTSIGGQSCVIYYVVLSNWPSGTTRLVSTLTLSQPVYDGQTIFPQGDYVYESDIQAS